MRAVKTNAFVWTMLVIVIGFEPHLALAAAITGFALAVLPLAFAPKLAPVSNHEHGHHDGTTYKLVRPGQVPFPVNPLPGDPPGRR